jgi:hypothetical protein
MRELRKNRHGRSIKNKNLERIRAPGIATSDDMGNVRSFSPALVCSIVAACYEALSGVVGAVVSQGLI